MRWVQSSSSSDFSGEPPSPRSGHSAVMTSGGRLVVFGGLLDKKFLGDLVVLDTANNLWFRPECTGSSNEGGVGPGPRAFHAAAALDCHLFIFGGRSGKKRMGDFWMLDTDTWQWAELSAYGDQPPARDFATAVAVGSGRLALFGGWDGSKWLSDVYILDTMSLEWRQLAVPAGPSPRCGHSAVMVEKRLLMLGGRGAGGSMMGDLWALKGLFEDEKEAAWTQLKLPGSSPAARCGHSCTASGTQVVVFGGHGTGGWLTRYDVYHNDCIVLDRASVQWRKLVLPGECPAPRAYHTLTRVGKRLFLLGGFDGKVTFGDFWWLVPDDDPLAKKAAELEAEAQATAAAAAAAAAATSLAAVVPVSKEPPISSVTPQHEVSPELPMAELRAKMGLPAQPNEALPPVRRQAHGLDDPELIHLGLRLLRTAQRTGAADQSAAASAKDAVEAARSHLEGMPAGALLLKELGILLADHHRLVASLHLPPAYDSASQLAEYRFYHIRTAQEIRMGDVAALQEEYRQVLQLTRKTSGDGA